MKPSVWYPLMLCFVLPGTGLADTKPVNLAEGLMLQHRYREAELEFERRAYDLRGRPEGGQAVANALEAASATNDAIFLLNVSRSWKGREELNCLPDLYESHALYRLDNMDAVIRSALAATCPATVREEKVYLEGLALMQLNRSAEAVSKFNQIPSGSEWSSKAVHAAKAAETPPRLKKPATAAALNALVPGAGYLYAARPQTAGAALVVTGLSAWGSYSAAKSGEIGLAVIASLLSFGWYVGGIYGGGTAAEHENTRRKAAWIGPFELHR